MANKRHPKSIPVGRGSLVLMAAIVLLVLLLFVLHRFYSKTEAPASSNTATLTAVGDISLTKEVLSAAQTADGYDFSTCFTQVLEPIAAADIAIGNLEGIIGAGEDYDADTHTYPAQLLTALKNCGFDYLLTANTYSVQDGMSGLIRTKQAVEQAGMQALGTYATQEERMENNGVLIQDVNGIRFAFIGFTKGVNNVRLPAGAEYSVNLLYEDYDTNYSQIDKEALAQAVAAAREQKPDVIVAMLHWGSEHMSEATDSQKQIADYLLGQGVDVILGSHSHVVGPMEGTDPTGEEAGNYFVAYSLGDFFSASTEEKELGGCILQLSFTKESSGKVSLTASYLPTFTIASGGWGTHDYGVYNSRSAIALYESQYYQRIPESLYTKLLASVEAIEAQISPEKGKDS